MVKVEIHLGHERTPAAHFVRRGFFRPAECAGKLPHADSCGVFVAFVQATQHVLPFKISKEQAIEKFLSFARKKRFIPKDFFEKNQVQKMTGDRKSVV